MPKFAHMSDIHIGAFRQPELKELLLTSFDRAIDRCIEERVEFVIISGDIFDSNIPDLLSVKRATRKIREARERGIRFYVIYGSHDSSPNYASIVDVLDSAGLFTKVERSRKLDGELQLEFIRDQSGVSLCGISGKKLSLDKSDYEALAKGPLEREPGVKIFVFHMAVEELKPQSLQMMSGVPGGYLPEGFDYYAGGHVHEHSVGSLWARKNVAYPGPLFAADFRDLEPMAAGVERGFYLVEFERTGVKAVEFVPIKVANVVELAFPAEGKSSKQVQTDLSAMVSAASVKGDVVLLKVSGQLSSGKTSDIDFAELRKRLAAKGPVCVLPNYSQLTSKEQIPVFGPLKSVQATEREAFLRGIKDVNPTDPKLRGERGVELSVDLLRTLKEEKRENETKADYTARTESSGFGVLGLEVDT
jgi:exonuclease SbcD